MSSDSEDIKNKNHPIVEDEKMMFAKVVKTVRGRKKFKKTVDFEAEMIKLRDTLSEERLEDDRAMLLDQMDRLAAISNVQNKRKDSDYIDPASPYFAHLRYENEGGEERDILLGKGTMIERDVRIVDWRNAPISKVFYQWREGDCFDEMIAARMQSGKITARRTLTIMDGQLLRINSPQGTFVFDEGSWLDITTEDPNLSGGACSSERPDTTIPLLTAGRQKYDLRGDKHLSEISSLLDQEQFELITRPGSGLVVIKGSAGSGKTTVGLHRIAYLNYNDQHRYRPKNMIIVVFNEALARYISLVLPALGVQNVKVKVLFKWARMMRLKHLPKLTRHYAQHVPAVVLRFKTHKMMIPLLEESVQKLKDSRVEDIFDELFTSYNWLKDGASKYAVGEFSEDEIKRIHDYCTNQHFWRVEKSGPNEDDLPTYDEEDDMILLRIYQLAKGSLCHSYKRQVMYDHMMVDEAQDFSPLELLVLMKCVKNNSVTLAGDLAQKIIEHNDFSQWSEVLEAIKHNHTEVNSLQISYRSTKHIMELANHVLGELAPSEPVKTIRQGMPAILFRSAGMGEAMTFLSEALSDLMQREPKAGVAVLCRNIRQAEEAYQALTKSDITGLKLVRNQDFSFTAGVEVTEISQTKGLEFDYVILLNVDTVTFPANHISRNLLHVGITRAIHQLWMFTWRVQSPLLPKSLKPHIV